VTAPWLTPWRLRVYPRLLLAAMGLALVFALCTGSGARIVSGRLGGDFAEFYAAGRIVLAGQAERLYDPAAQRAAERDLMPDAAGDVFVPFAYPPQFALPYALLAALPYRVAFAVHLAAMAGLLFLAVRIACRDLPWAAPYTAAVFCAAILFYPLLRALLGGQNTPLSLCLFAAAWSLERRGRMVAAGLCLAALCFKPQLGLGLLALYTLAGRTRLALSACLGLAVLLAGATAVFGPSWPAAWLGYADWVVRTSLGMEGEMAVSFPGVARHLLAAWPRAGLAAGLGAACAVLACLGVVFWRRRGRSLDRPCLGLAAAGLLLAAPHAYFYDAGLLVFPALALLDARLPRAASLVCGLWLAGWAQLFAPRLGLSPLFPAALALFGLCLALVAAPRRVRP
jgi:hypothetical protein